MLLKLVLQNTCTKKLLHPTLLSPSHNNFVSSRPKKSKVCILGANNRVGRPLSLLLKCNPRISQLSLFDDNEDIRSIVTELRHMNTTSKIAAYTQKREVKGCLMGADVVIILGKFKSCTETNKEKAFKDNARIVKYFSSRIAEVCPNALVEIIANPINSTVPIAVEVMKHYGVFDERRIFGLAKLNAIRASSFLARIKQISPKSIVCPVVGGVSGKTIVPLLSQTKIDLEQHELQFLTKQIQDAEIGVPVEPTLSVAYAAALFTESLLRGLQGQKGVTECAYVKSNVTEAEYFVNPITLGPNGVQENLGQPILTAFEEEMISKALPELISNIKKGTQFLTSGDDES